MTLIRKMKTTEEKAEEFERLDGQNVSSQSWAES